MFKLEEPEIETEQSQPAGFVQRRPPAALLLMVRGQEVTPPNNRVALTESVTIGRERPCDLTLDDPCMSGVHFRNILNNGRASIEDLGSTNDTYINGLRIESRIPLADGALIRAGSCLFAFHSDGEAVLAAFGQIETHSLPCKVGSAVSTFRPKAHGQMVR